MEQTRTIEKEFYFRTQQEMQITTSQVIEEMREFPVPPSELPKDVNGLAKVEFLKEGGVLTYIENHDYPYHGFPHYEYVQAIDYIKKITRAFLSGMYHNFKTRNKLWFLTLLPALWVGKLLVRSAIYVFHRMIHRFLTKPLRYSYSIRELHRAGTEVAVKDYEFMIRDLLCMILEYDNAYRYRFQDIAVELDKKALTAHPARELSRLFELMAGREKTVDLQDTWTLMRYAVTWYLRFDRQLLKFITSLLLDLNLEQVRLIIDDKHYCVYRKDYTFGFMLSPSSDDQNMITVAKLDQERDAEITNIRDQSTQAHTVLSQIHEKARLAVAPERTPEYNAVLNKDFQTQVDKINEQFIRTQQTLQEKYEKDLKALSAEYLTTEEKELIDKQTTERLAMDKEYDDKLNAIKAHYDQLKQPYVLRK